MRFRLRTLLIVLALGPLAIAAGWWAVRELREYLGRSGPVEAPPLYRYIPPG